ncbi:MAG TPA: HAD family hydrolase, partial [Tianweitania sediminis]|nr:HAD family hydrolase [Tianweitania sediminis]
MRAVFFDVDGVLLHSFFHPDPAKRRRWDDHLLEDVGIAPEQLNGFFETRFNAAMLGQTSIITELDAYLPTIGYVGSSLDFLSYWLMRDTHINLPLLNLIRRLRTRSDAALYIATNQEHIRAFHLWNEVGLRHYFDDMFHAARFGVSKSDAAYYTKVEEVVGGDAEAPLIFDDSERVIAAAGSA